MNFVIQRSARQVSAHAKRCLDTLVVAGELNEGAIAHALIKEPGPLVFLAHFQGDAEYARDDGAFFEPLEQLPSDARPSIRRSHGEKIQVRVIVAVAHDRETGNVPANTRDDHVDIRRANTRCYSHRRPAPAETVFD